MQLYYSLALDSPLEILNNFGVLTASQCMMPEVAPIRSERIYRRCHNRFAIDELCHRSPGSRMNSYPASSGNSANGIYLKPLHSKAMRVILL
jgi:hypothetical protein